MRGAYGKPQGLVARVKIGQPIMSMRTKMATKTMPSKLSDVRSSSSLDVKRFTIHRNGDSLNGIAVNTKNGWLPVFSFPTVFHASTSQTKDHWLHGRSEICNRPCSTNVNKHIHLQND